MNTINHNSKALSIHPSQRIFPFWLKAFIFFFAAGIFLLPAIPQDPHYHQFADTQTLLGLANCSNVLSNLPFLAAGIVGFLRTLKWENSPDKRRWQFFFLSIGLVAFGSGYYHYQPNTATLFWDRLPMTFGFASLSASFFSQRFSKLNGSKLFASLLFLGSSAILYWHYSESIGKGDLRPYIVVQFLPLILIPLVLLKYPQSKRVDLPYWILFAAYSLAKIFEVADLPIYQLTGFISGHTLKHLAAGAGLYFFGQTLTPPPISQKKKSLL